MKRRKRARAVYTTVYILQVLAEALAAFVLIKLNLLPNMLLYAALAGLVLLLCITAAMLFVRSSKSLRNRRYVTGVSVTGVILSLIITLASLFGSYVAYRFYRTLDKVTSPTEISDTIGVYVRYEDPAHTLSDVADYRFAVTQAYDAENSNATVKVISEHVGKDIETQEYDSVLAMVDALLNGEADAMILNTAYAGILVDVEGYEDFDIKARLLYEHNILRKKGTAGASGEDPDDLTPSGKADDIKSDAFVVYLSGSDTRSQMLTTSRSDVNILMVVNPTTHEILMVNTPRDYYVQISIGGGAYDKLTHCGIYGIDCSMDTLAALYDIDIGYYAQINFTGFEKLIDAFGGVTVYSEQAFSAMGYDYVEGDNYLDGPKALAFARERHAFASGDNQRGKNQMKILRAVINKATSSTALIQNYSGILESLEGMFITNFSSDEISALVKKQIEDGGSWNIHNFAVTGANGNEATYSLSTPNYVMYQDPVLVNKASELMKRVINGEHLSDADVAIG